jgi:predicted Zn finger-like uncharacterized protein
MIVQCEICGAKYNIEDAKITSKGVKVRCAKCKHVFSVEPPSLTPPPPQTQQPQTPSPTPPTSGPAGDDFLQDFESFEKFHKDLMDTPGPEPGPPIDEESPFERGEFEGIPQDTGEVPSEVPSMEEFPTEEWPGPSPEQQKPTESLEGEMDTPTFDMEGLEEERYVDKPQVIPKKKKTSRSFVLIGILLIVALGGYYLWSERGMEFSLPGNIPSLIKSVPENIKSIPEKLQYLWEDIRGIERGSLTFSDLEGYKDIIGEVPVFVITGKILNDTNKTKKHVRIKAVLLNDKNKVLDEKQTMCGSYFTKENLKKLPPRFTRGDFKLRPPVPSQMRVAPRMSVPFIVIFPKMPPDAQEFQVEIVDAPNA